MTCGILLASFALSFGGPEPNEGIADLSFLNERPAGAAGRITAQGGHFIDGRGRRIRLWGTNLTFGGAFPPHDEADVLAKRLASLGFNCVRIHHIDKECAPRGIWKKAARKDTFDPDQLDRLHYFLAALKRQGIYWNLNLHVSRAYWEGADFADGLTPEERRAKLPTHCKGIDRLDERLIAMQKDYARAFLATVNPHTGCAPVDDTALAMVEINNENTVHNVDFSKFPEFWQVPVREKWTTYLSAKYGTQAALVAAWQPKGAPQGEIVSLDGMALQGGGSYAKGKFLSKDAWSGELVKKPACGWMAQLLRTGLDLEEGKTYTLSFEVRGEARGKVRANVQRDHDDYRNLGLAEDFEVAPEWRRFTRAFVAGGVESGRSRIALALGNLEPGRIEFRGIELRRGGTPVALREGESLGDGTVGIGYVGGKLSPRGRDWTDFLTRAECGYTKRMRRFLREELGCKAMIIDSQASYGKELGLLREKDSDYLDNHSYWEHPQFPGVQWDKSNWTIRNTPMSDDFKKGGTFAGLEKYRDPKRPYVVSEYDHPVPSEYTALQFPMVSAYASAHDWDGIFQFDWGSGNASRLCDFFRLEGNPAKLAFLPAAGLTFRRGDVSVADLVWTSDVFRVDAPCAKVLAGRIGGTANLLKDVRVEFGESPFDRFGVFTVSAADGRPVRESGRILIAEMASCRNTGMVYSEDRHRIRGWGKAPVLGEVVPAKVSFVGKDGDYAAYALEGKGRRLRQVRLDHAGDGLVLEIDDAADTVWFELVHE